MANKKLHFNIKLSNKDMIKGLNLPAELSQNLAYLCGILVGDGSIYKRHKKNDYIIKCVGNPKDEKELYHKVIGPLFKKTFGFKPAIKYQDSNTTFGFTIHSKSLFLFLTEVMGLTYGRKDNNLKIPDIFKEKISLTIPLIKGIYDTDGCISFKKRYRDKPYYPVITLASKSKRLINDTAKILKDLDFKVVEIYDYKLMDKRIISGFTIINRIELNGKENLRIWLKKIGFSSPKHLNKIKKYSGDWTSRRTRSVHHLNQ